MSKKVEIYDTIFNYEEDSPRTILKELEHIKSVLNNQVEEMWAGIDDIDLKVDRFINTQGNWSVKETSIELGEQSQEEVFLDDNTVFVELYAMRLVVKQASMWFSKGSLRTAYLEQGDYKWAGMPVGFLEIIFGSGNSFIYDWYGDSTPNPTTHLIVLEHIFKYEESE